MNVVSGNPTPPRFRIRLEDGSEIAVSSVEALARRVGRGDLLPDTPLFDASIGGWRRAGDVAVVRFLIEEIVKELGAYPDGWTAEAISNSPAIDARSGGISVRANIDLTGFTIVDEPAEIRRPGEKGKPAKGDDEVDDHRFEFTLEELPADPEAYPPLPPSDEVLVPIGTTEEWLQTGLGGGMDERPPSHPHTTDEWGNSPDEPSQQELPSASGRRSERSWYSGRLFRGALLAAVIAGGFWFWSDRVERSVSYLVEIGRLQRPTRVINTSLPFIEIPTPAPVPPGLESEVASAVESFGELMRRNFSVLRREEGLESAPPSAWLSGYYMANAAEFDSIPAFWEGYRRIVEELHQREETVFLALLAEEAERLEQTDPDRAKALYDYLLSRWETALPARDALYASLALTADAAVDLHTFLVENQESLRYTPAVGPEVPDDPVLEVEVSDPEVDEELKEKLDRVLMALDRSRSDRVSVLDGIEAALFTAVERF